MSEGEDPKVYLAEEIRGLMRLRGYSKVAGRPNIYERTRNGIQEFVHFDPPEDHEPQDRAFVYRDLIEDDS